MPTEIVVAQIVIMGCCYDSPNCIEGVNLEGTLMLPAICAAKCSALLQDIVPTKPGTICLPPASSCYS
jgi:hypothetical protein